MIDINEIKAGRVLPTEKVFYEIMDIDLDNVNSFIVVERSFSIVDLIDKYNGLHIMQKFDDLIVINFNYVMLHYSNESIRYDKIKKNVNNQLYEIMVGRMEVSHKFNLEKFETKKRKIHEIL